MAKLMAGFIQNCKVIFSYQNVKTQVRARGKTKKRRPKHKIVLQAKRVGGRLGRRMVYYCIFKG